MRWIDRPEVATFNSFCQQTRNLTEYRTKIIFSDMFNPRGIAASAQKLRLNDSGIQRV